MSRSFDLTTSLTAWLFSRIGAKRSLRKIRRRNEKSRGVYRAGNVTCGQLLPVGAPLGSVLITGGNEDVRNALLVQGCLQASASGMPVVLLHEGNRALEQALLAANAGLRKLDIVNAASPHYDPIYRLSDTQASMLLMRAVPDTYGVGSQGLSYLQAMCRLLRTKGVVPHVRMLACAPFAAMQTVIAQTESQGHITANEAAAISAQLAAGENVRSGLERFFVQLMLESNLFAHRQHLPRSASIAECARAGSVLAIDIGSLAKETQTSLIAAEIESCITSGTAIRVMIDALSLQAADRLQKLLKCASGNLVWTISTPDAAGMMGGKAEELSLLMMETHRTVMFTHGLRACEMFSRELGEYDYIDVTQSGGSNASIGAFGFNFGSGRNMSTSLRRERAIKPEEIAGLGDRGFILMDNKKGALYKGVLR